MQRNGTKYDIPRWCICDYNAVEKHLEKRAAEGWAIDNLGIFIWKFKKDSPSKKRFSVVFSKSNSEFGTAPTKEQRLLFELTEEDGWKNEGKWNKMQIFSTTDLQADALETDEAVRFLSIQRAIEFPYIINYLLAGICLLILVTRSYSSYHGNPTLDNLWALIITGYCLGFAVCMLFEYGMWIRLSQQSIEKGGSTISSGWIYITQNILTVGLFLLLFGYISVRAGFTLNGFLRFLFCAATAIGIVCMVGYMPVYLRNHGYNPKLNIVLTMLAGIVASVIYVMLFHFAM